MKKVPLWGTNFWPRTINKKEQKNVLTKKEAKTLGDLSIKQKQKRINMFYLNRKRKIFEHWFLLVKSKFENRKYWISSFNPYFDGNTLTIIETHRNNTIMQVEKFVIALKCELKFI